MQEELKNENSIDRKKFLMAAGLIGASVPVTELYAANSHAGHGPSKGAAAVAKAASECASLGEICVTHCVDLVRKGDTSIAECIATVNEAVAACTALSSLANYNSMHLKQFAKACKGICGHCENECKKHAKKHKACKDCADACARCIQAINKIL